MITHDASILTQLCSQLIYAELFRQEFINFLMPVVQNCLCPTHLSLYLSNLLELVFLYLHHFGLSLEILLLSSKPISYSTAVSICPDYLFNYQGYQWMA